MGQILESGKYFFIEIGHEILSKAVSLPTDDLGYRKIPKFSDANNFAVIYLKFKQRGQTFGNFVKKVQME